MFNDYYWISNRSEEQEERYTEFINNLNSKVIFFMLLLKQNDKLAVIEIGCGTAVPTVRYNTNYLSKNKNVDCIRINPTDQDKNKKIIQIRDGGLSGIKKINEVIQTL